MKKSNKSFVSLVLSVLIIASSLFLGSAAKMDPLLQNASTITLKLFNFDKSNDEKYTGNIFSYYLNGLDGVQDYIISEGDDGGYAIYEKKSLRLIEYTDYGRTPYDKLYGKQRYYGGPLNYYVGKSSEEYLLNLMTNQRINRADIANMAKAIKQEIASFKDFNCEEVENTAIDADKALSITQNISGGTILEDADLYTISSKQMISKQQYFKGNDNHGVNNDGCCTSVATQLLLGYNNWNCDGRLIPEIGVNGEIFLKLDRELDKPYSDKMLATTSETDTEERTFFEVIKEYINPQSGATLSQACNGINQYLRTYVPNLQDDFVISTQECASSDVENRVRICSLIDAELLSDRPVVTSIYYYVKDGIDDYTKKAHSTVTYGKQTVILGNEQIQGYIMHFGWESHETHIWIDSSFITGYLSFHTNHIHNDQAYLGNNHIKRCLTCGRTTASNEHTFNFQEASIISMGEFVDEGQGKIVPLEDVKNHLVFCSCGYGKIVRHQFDTFANPDENYHDSTCSACGYHKKEYHLYKADAEHCFYCGYNRMGV